MLPWHLTYYTNYTPGGRFNQSTVFFEYVSLEKKNLLIRLQLGFFFLHHISTNKLLVICSCMVDYQEQYWLLISLWLICSFLCFCWGGGNSLYKRIQSIKCIDFFQILNSHARKIMQSVCGKPKSRYKSFLRSAFGSPYFKKKHILLYMFKLPVVKLNLNTGTDVLSVRKDA